MSGRVLNTPLNTFGILLFVLILTLNMLVTREIFKIPFGIFIFYKNIEFFFLKVDMQR